MKSFLFLVLLLAACLSLSACGKKEPAITDIQEPYSMDEMSAVQVAPPVQAVPKAEPAPIVPVAEVKTEVAVPVAAVSKPTVEQIQTALKNAGYYTGTVDGKSGPLTKRAIEDFQQANNLEVDGKVGSKTWVVLSKYLNPAPAPSGKKR